MAGSLVHLKIAINKNGGGNFGFSYKKRVDSGYEVSKVSDCLASPPIALGDILQTINGKPVPHDHKMDSWDTWIVEVLRPTSWSNADENSLSLTSEDFSNSISLKSGASSISVESLVVRPSSYYGLDPSTPKEMALVSPSRIKWSPPQTITYPTAANLRINYKRKCVQAYNQEFVLVKGIEPVNHYSGYGGLAVGDWLLSIDNIPVTFVNVKKFVEYYLPSTKGEVKFSVQRPESIIPNERHVYRADSLHSNDIQALVGPSLPSPIPSDLSQSAEVSSEFQSIHQSVLLESMERLTFCKVFYHHIMDDDNALLSDIFNNSLVQTEKSPLLTIMQTHLFSNSNREIFSKPTQTNCYSGQTNSCDFEKQQMVGKVYERLKADERMGLLNTEHDVTSGQMSLSDVKQFSHQPQINARASYLHLDVLYPHHRTNITINKPLPWFTPVLYCKHSVHIIQTREVCLAWLTSLLREIYTHSKGQAKVILVVHPDRDRREDFINYHFKEYLAMLVHDGHLAFHNPSANDIRRVLISTLNSLSKRSVDQRYPYLSVELKQFLLSKTGIIAQRTIIEQTEKLVSKNYAQVEKHVNTTLKYLHDTGQAYVPALSYSKKMMKAESDLTNFILLRPTDLLNIVSTLTIQSSDELDRTKLAYLKEQGCSSEKFLMQMFSASDVKEMITLLKDLCVVVPCKGSVRREVLVKVPFMQPEKQVDIPYYTPGANRPPDLMVGFMNTLPKVIMARFLSTLEMRSTTSTVNYSTEKGRFHIFGTTVIVSRMIPDCSGLQLFKVDRTLCLYIIQDQKDRASKTTVFEFTREMRDLLCHLFVEAKDGGLIEFGPGCPEETCSDRPFHIFNLLSSNEQFSCEGIPHETHPLVKEFLAFSASPRRVDMKQLRTNTRIDNLPGNIHRMVCDALNEENFRNRNWHCLADLLNYTPQQKDTFKRDSNPTEALFRDAGSRQLVSVQQLCLLLADNQLGRLDVKKDLEDWIDS